MEVDSMEDSTSRLGSGVQAHGNATEGTTANSNGTVMARAETQYRGECTNGTVAMVLDNAENEANSCSKVATAIMAYCGIPMENTQAMETDTAGSGNNQFEGTDAAIVAPSRSQTDDPMLTEDRRAERNSQSAEQTKAAERPRPTTDRSGRAEASRIEVHSSSIVIVNGAFRPTPGSIDSVAAIAGMSKVISPKSPGESHGFGASDPRKAFSIHNPRASSAALDVYETQVHNASLRQQLERAETDPPCSDFLDPQRRTQAVCQNATNKANVENDNQSIRGKCSRHGLSMISNSDN